MFLQQLIEKEWNSPQQGRY